MPVKGKSNRDTYHGECTTMLHRADIYARPSVTGIFAGYEVSEPDIFCIGRGGFVVECKTARHGTFPMGTTPKTGAGWREDQIEWAIEYREKSKCEYWLFVVYETEESPWKLRIPRDAFLVPFQAAYDVMKLLPQKSLPYKVRKGLDREIQLNSWDAVTLWGKYRLHWKSGWQVPESHLFHSLYIAPTPQVPMTIGEIEHGNSLAISAEPA